MLPHHARLRVQTDFDRVRTAGTRHYGSGVLLFCAPSPAPVSRVACVVGKKYHASAVRRNRQRRVLQAACRTLHPALCAPVDVVVIYTNRHNVLPYKKAVATIATLLHQAGAMSPNAR